MEMMMSILITIGIYFMPILCIIFCTNLVTIIKKVKIDEKTTTNTIWLTISFTLIMWSLAMMGLAVL